ncbi:4707_t:CDS:1 [Acaulospora colombiana]|uniref:4707_t:CDS:1 n=1 Tax=Acaulospora colombiana TaxID=27376 RepID=A0ACA9LB17_9GLOM|nr:4707_t:CDS:1 [Acaulospora colombiana]
MSSINPIIVSSSPLPTKKTRKPRALRAQPYSKESSSYSKKSESKVRDDSSGESLNFENYSLKYSDLSSDNKKSLKQCKNTPLQQAIRYSLGKVNSSIDTIQFKLTSLQSSFDHEIPDIHNQISQLSADVHEIRDLLLVVVQNIQALSIAFPSIFPYSYSNSPILPLVSLDHNYVTDLSVNLPDFSSDIINAPNDFDQQPLFE